jgi:hypothetical protein
MKKNLYFLVLSALGAALISCDGKEPQVQENGNNEIMITVPATMADDTRTAFHGEKGRTVWREGDQLQVIAYYNNPEDNIYESAMGGYRLFEMTGDFNEDYAEFSGLVSKVPFENGTFLHHLHAFYPAKAMTASARYEVTLPTTQKPTLESFDGDAAFMCSAPLPIELSSSTTGRVDPFRFQHMTGFLRLKFGDLPEGMGSETIARITMSGESGSALSGIFKFQIDEEAFGETYTLSEVTPQNYIILDYSDKNLTWNDLTDCWFATVPGTYENVTFTVVTASGKTISYAPRTGLEIREGVITPATLNFREGDKLIEMEERTISIAKNAFPLTSTSSARTGTITVSPEEDSETSFVIDYNGLVKSSTASSWNAKINTVTSNSTNPYANIYNKAPLGAKIISISIETTTATAGDGDISFGTAANADAFETYQSGTGSSLTFTPRDPGVDYQFFAIRGRNFQIKSMTIKYAVIVE